MADAQEVPMASARRRRWVIGAATLGTVTVLAASAWFMVVPNWRPSLDNGERYGIDVSRHQGEIHWEAVAEDGIDFAHIKSSEGQGWVDEWFDENWTGSDRVGLDRGAYHFFTLCAAGADQARNFLSVVPPTPGALPPAVDLEFSGNCSDRPSAIDVAKELGAFIEIVEDAWEREVVLYVMDSWESTYPVKSVWDRQIWERRLILRPDSDWFVWQFHASAEVDGISGGVDLNVMRNRTL